MLIINRHRSGTFYNGVPLPPGAEYLGTVIRDATLAYREECVRREVERKAALEQIATNPTARA